MRFSALVVLSALFLTGCDQDGGYEVEVPSVDYEDMAKASPRICPAIAIHCAEGYEAVQLPNCRQFCLPENEPECLVDADCPTIYCITEPCPQMECQGRTCVW